MKEWFLRSIRWLGIQLFPSVCPVCGEALVRGERTICVRCRWDMPLTDYWLAADNPAITMLREHLPAMEHASALMYFRSESGYRSMIHSLKYSGRRDIAIAMGEMFGRELSESPFYGDITVLVPVPLHWSKRIQRGYNQAEEICVGLSRSMGVATDFRAIRRIRRTQTQALHRDSEARRKNVKGAFGLCHPDRLRGQHILLVDDVLTTGATIEACVDAILAVLPDARISVATLATVRGRTQKVSY